jgi:hypothetical protein
VDQYVSDSSISEKARRMGPKMTQSEEQNAQSPPRQRKARKAPDAGLLARIWSNWRVEVVIVAVVALAVFLLVERMEIRQTFLAWAHQGSRTARHLLEDMMHGLAAAVQRTTLSDLTGLVLLAIALAVVTWRVRWRLLRTTRYTARTCPLCGEGLKRTHRRRRDRIVNLYVPVRRYRCRNPECRWRGLRVWTGVGTSDRLPSE